MNENPVAKKPVLFQTQTGLYLGLVCFNPVYETLKFVLEKREFFEVEWPALVSAEEKGLIPILLGLPYFTIQRSQIIWYTLQIPEGLLKYYQTFLPHVFSNTSLQGELISAKSFKSITNQDTNKKIIPFPFKKDDTKTK
ncbi:MAG: hypothetical protein C0190_00785 [Thermodesulfobacterium geofontis]|uniref:Uncharacterized protein n=1 Tax=Thermodesulfobacterium geofontis TaxID=1295609 RepID=A0A2N7PQE6_9BACT|nr:MAG: hypothetical protein C0190_00785 [Thermodesulfobacterium geofontis]PMP98036.1 MAG: hypothetical protein C0169_01005 [Thermodesulfobacterium geofontis]